MIMTIFSFCINKLCFLGHFLLTYLLIDLIKKSAPARIITVSSMAHSWGSINLEDINSEKSYDKSKAYAQSKLANVLFSHTLAKKLEGEHFTHPKVVLAILNASCVLNCNRSQIFRYCTLAVSFML